VYMYSYESVESMKARLYILYINKHLQIEALKYFHAHHHA